MSKSEKLGICFAIFAICMLIGGVVWAGISSSRYASNFRTTCAQKGGIALEDGHWYCIKPEGIIPN